MLGVANLDQMRLYNQVYQKIGIDYGIVNSIDGYDEISLTSDFKVTTNNYERIFKPQDLGLGEELGMEIDDATLIDGAVELVHVVSELHAVVLDDIGSTAHGSCSIVAMLSHLVAR